MLASMMQVSRAEKYERMREMLNEKQWRHYLALEATEVNVYDFLSIADGKAIPYGICDLIHHHGFVNVGIDHDTAEFAVESIRRWWQQWGKLLYPDKKTLLITADGGGSNGVRNRLWKKKLQELADEEQLAITVAHYPPA
jgi:Rhodopirellula transposase DDE domain